MRPGDASFARSFDPCTLILTMLLGESLGGGALEEASRSGKPAQAGGTGTGAFAGGRSAARRASLLSQESRRGATKKRKEIKVSVPARTQEPGFGCPHVVVAVAEVGRRRLVPNTLGKRAPKRAAGSSERGPSSERGSAGETVGSRVERRERRESASPLRRERSGAGPGWREIVIQRFPYRRKRCGGRGTGAVMATGSYEGSLPIEGTPDHHEASAFTRRRRRWSRRFSHPPTRSKPPKRRTGGQIAARAKAGEARG